MKPQFDKRNKKTAVDNLQQCKQQLAGALKWLERSYSQCKAIEPKKTFSDEEFDKLENLTSRFARVTDLLINKMF